MNSSRVVVDDATEDNLFRLFDGSQGLQRRVFRVLARGFFNEYGLNEIQHQAEGLIREIEDLRAKLPKAGSRG